MSPRKTLRWTAISLLALLGTIDAARGQIRHRFVAVDNARNHLLCIDEQEPAKNWVVAIPPGSRDLQRLDQGRLLVSHGNGAAEYDLATGRKLAWAVERYSHVNTAQRLAGGDTLLGANHDAGIVLYRVDRDGKEIGQTLLPKMKDLRLLRPLENGNILLTVSSPCRVIEVTPRGETVWQAALPGKGYKAVRLADGNTLVSTGGEATVIELNRAGEVVHTVGGKKAHPTLGLDWSSGFDLLPGGDILMANWLGHGKQGTGPHLVEFDRNNRVVWRWEDHRQAAAITNVLVLDPAARSL